MGVSVALPANAGRGLLALLVCTLTLVPSLIWALRDRRVWPWDQAWYGEVSVDLWYLLFHAPGVWFQTMFNGLYMKPPALVWIGQFFVPLHLLLGSVEPALLLSILLTQFILLIFVYRMSRRLCPEKPVVAFLAAAATAGTQAFVALSHQYVVEPLQGLAVAWVVWIAVDCRDWPRARTVIHLAAATLLGILTKASTPLYALIPTIVVLGRLYSGPRGWDFRAEWRRISSSLLTLLSLVGGAFGALWYKRNFAAVVQHVRDSSSGDVALHYGFRAPPWEKFFVWLRYSSQAFLSPFLSWTLALAAFAALLFFLLGRRSSLSRMRSAAAALALLQILVVLFAFALNDAVETRYLFALLPYVAILFLVFFSAVPNPAVLGLIFCACIAQIAIANWACFEPAAFLSDRFPWLQVVQRDPVPYQEIAAVAKRTSIAPGYDIVGMELPWLNANSVAFFAAKNRLTTGVRSYYTSIGYAEKDPAAAMRRIEDFKARFVITLDESFQPPPDFLNLVALPVLRTLETSDNYSKISFPSQKGIVVFARQNRTSASTSDAAR